MIKKMMLLALLAADMVAIAAMTISPSRAKNTFSSSGVWVCGLKNAGRIIRLATTKVASRTYITTEGQIPSPFIDRRNKTNQIGLFTRQVDCPFQGAALLAVIGQEKTDRNKQIPGNAGLTGQLNTRFALV
jgi:hypothetical protein